MDFRNRVIYIGNTKNGEKREVSMNDILTETLKSIKRINSRGVAQPGLAHLPWEQGVGGSNPLAPTSNIVRKMDSYAWKGRYGSFFYGVTLLIVR